MDAKGQMEVDLAERVVAELPAPSAFLGGGVSTIYDPDRHGQAVRSQEAHTRLRVCMVVLEHIPEAEAPAYLEEGIADLARLYRGTEGLENYAREHNMEVSEASFTLARGVVNDARQALEDSIFFRERTHKNPPPRGSCPDKF